MDFNEIRQLLATIAQTDIAEVTLKSDDFELTVRKAVGATNQMLPAVSGGVVGVSGLTTPVSPPAPQVILPAETATNRSEKNVVASGALPVNSSQILEQKLIDVPSPMVGTFYRAPAPSEPPFVEVGDRVKRGQTVCIIEAMKLMNEIEAEVSGQVVEILLRNGEPVEYGQPLMRINPD
nr:acetyl-CoA carboxylase biotin carboxyl carrier protein [Iningainema tapete]